MAQLKISIVTVSYNSGRTIAATIESVIAQSYSNIEYLVIDGKSTDDTCAIIDSYGDRIDVFVSEPDGGIYSAWNKGVKMTTGDYIFILNSDDTFYDRDVVRDAVEFINANGNPLVAYAKLYSYEPETSYSYIDGRPTHLRELLFKMHYCALSAFVHHTVYRTVGFFREDLRISSDVDWAIRLFSRVDNSRLVFFDRLVIRFRVDGCSNSNSCLAYEEIRQIVRAHFSLSDYCRHRLYVKILFLKKRLIPFVRSVGLLGLWRRYKTIRS